MPLCFAKDKDVKTAKPYIAPEIESIDTEIPTLSDSLNEASKSQRNIQQELVNDHNLQLETQKDYFSRDNEDKESTSEDDEESIKDKISKNKDIEFPDLKLHVSKRKKEDLPIKATKRSSNNLKINSKSKK